MVEQESFYNALQRLRAKNRHRQTLSYGQIAAISELPERTVVNWFSGRITRKPRNWRHLIKLAIALQLDHVEVDELLAAARHPSLNELRDRTKSAEDRELLAPWPPVDPPFQAENILPYFTDREGALSEIIEALTLPHPPPLVSIEGMPGVGKTELAAIAAHRLGKHFHDGVLWVDVNSADTLAKLGELGIALQVDLTRFRQLPDRSRAFKEVLRKKKVLIVLDGVTSDEEVDPFLPPAGSTSTVIVTTRRRDLWTTRSAHSVYIEEFTDVDAMNLFINVLGQSRVVAEQHALQTLASYAGNLPIAVDITAHLLKRTSNRSASEYLQLIEESEVRLLQLKLGTQTNIFYLFETSFEQLSSPQQQLFSTLGIFAGPDFSTEAVAYVNRLSISRAKRLLIDLVDASLVKETMQGRYRLHTLLRDYANTKLTLTEPTERMIWFYTEYAYMHRLDFSAIAREADNIRESLEIALRHNKNREIVDGTLGLYKYLEARGLFAEARSWLDKALAATQELADKAAEARIITYQADLERIGGDLKGAQGILDLALPLAEESQDIESLCGVWQAMGTIRAYMGDMPGAETEFQRALDIAREGRYDLGASALISNLCAARLYQGKREGTADLLREGLELARATGIQEVEAKILSNLASLEDSLDHTAAANDYLKQSLDLARVSGHRSTIINVSANLAATEINLKDYTGAAAHLLEALIQARELGDVEALIRVLRNYGELYSETGNDSSADEHFAEALQLAHTSKNDLLVLIILTDWGERLVESGAYEHAQSHFEEMIASTSQEDFPEFMGIALLGMAKIREVEGNIEEACRFAREALTLFEKISDPHKAEASEFLKKLSCTDPPPG